MSVRHHSGTDSDTGQTARDGWGAWPLRGSQLAFLLGAYLLLVLALWGVGTLLVGSMDGPVGELDRSVSSWMVDQRTEALHPTSDIASGFSDTATVVVALAVLGAAFVAVWRHWGEATVLLTALALEVSTFVTAAYLVGRDRPDVQKLDPAPPTSSFPSGHVAAAVALYGGLAYIVFRHTENRVARIGAVLMAVGAPLAVALSRMYRGMHYLTDVTAGALLGAACLAVAIYVVRGGLREQGADEELVA